MTGSAILANSVLPNGRCAMLLTDIAGYGRLLDTAAQERMRGHHYTILEDCLRDSGVRPEECYGEDRGDGILVIIPDPAEKHALLSPFLEKLQLRLRKHNLGTAKEKRIRLRVALHVGDVRHDGKGLTGPDLNRVFRLCDSPKLKEDLRESGASIAFIASDEVYQAVIRTAPAPIDPDDFTPVPIAVKETQTAAWVQFRGRVDPQSHTGGQEALAALCPYPGLAPFDADYMKWFHGREPEINQLLERLERHLERLRRRRHEAAPLVVMGPSGVGKSSLLRAGLLRALREGRLGVPGSQNWPWLLFTPTAEPVRELAARLRELTETDIDPKIENGGVDRLTAFALRTLLEQRTPTAVPVIVVDQFEEIFTLCSDQRQRRDFVHALCSLAEGAEGLPPALVVLGLRADFVGQSMAIPELADALRDYMPLAPMRPAALREAIEGPARAVGRSVEPALVERLLHDLGVSEGTEAPYDPGALPLLCHVLRRTWRQSRGGTLALDEYRDTIQNAIAETAQGTYDELDPPQRRIARRMLLRMIKISTDGQSLRRVDRTRLVEESTDPAAAEAVLEHLSQARLVTLDETSAGITHDALLYKWPRLREWIDEDRAGLLVRQRLIEAAENWQAEGRDPASLYVGARLEEAKAWREKHPHDDDLPQLAREFLDAARAAKEQREREAGRRAQLLRALFVSLCVATVLAVLLAWGAFDARRTAARERDEALSRQLSGQAAGLLLSRPDLALLLSLQAYRVQASPQARDGLLSTQAHLNSVLLPAPGPAYGVAFAPDGGSLAAAHKDGVTVWQRAPHRFPEHPREVFPGHWSFAVAHSPDGRRLAAAGHDGVVRISDGRRLVRELSLTGVDATPDPRNLPDRRLRRPVTGLINGLAFSRDGRLLAAASHDGGTWVWNVDDGRLLRRLLSDRGPLESVAFSPDGGTLAAAGADGRVVLWDTERLEGTGGLQPRRSLADHRGPVRALAFSRDGAALASGDDYGTIVVRDPDSGETTARLTRHIGPVRALAFGPEGGVLASGGEDASVRLWDVAAGDQITTLTGPTRPVTGVSFSPDGGTLAAADAHSGVRLWRLGALGRGDSGVVSALVPGPAGRAPSLATVARDGALRSWDTLTGRLTGALGTDDDLRTARALASSGDGRRLAVATDKGVALRALPAGDPPENGMPSMLASKDATRTVALSPGGDIVAGTSGMRLTFWAVRDKTTRTLTPHPSPIGVTAFDPGGQVAATGSEDGTVALSPVKDAPPIVCGAHVGPVRALAFDPSGDRLASAGDDHTVKLWRVDSGWKCTHLRTLKGHTQAVTALAFGGDGTRLASAGEDRVIKLWDTRRDRGTSDASAKDSSFATLATRTGATALMFAAGILVSADPRGLPMLWQHEPARVADRVCGSRPALPVDWSEYTARALPPLCPRP